MPLIQTQFLGKALGVSGPGWKQTKQTKTILRKSFGWPQKSNCLFRMRRNTTIGHPTKNWTSCYSGSFPVLMMKRLNNKKSQKVCLKLQIVRSSDCSQSLAWSPHLHANVGHYFCWKWKYIFTVKCNQQNSFRGKNRPKIALIFVQDSVHRSSQHFYD